MTDTKLDPATLTAEERAIVDHEAARFHRDWTGEARYRAAFGICEPIILARRALFAPATEKAVCPNCKRDDTGHSWKVNGELRYSCASTNKPAPPEPAAPVHRVTEQGRVEVNKAALFASPAVQEVYEIAGRIVDHGKPEPATEKAHESAFPVGNCPSCGKLEAPYNKHAKYEGGYTCQPAQPDPAAVRSAAKRLRRLAVAYRESLDEHEHRNMLDKKADDAEGKR